MESGFAVQTEGVNFEAVWALPGKLILANEILCNDIWRVLKTFGVEAARASIVTEFQGPFIPYYTVLRCYLDRVLGCCVVHGVTVNVSVAVLTGSP